MNLHYFGYSFQNISTVCYPKDEVCTTFKILGNGSNAPFTIKWNNPANYIGEGPFTITAKQNFSLDFEIINAKHDTSRFTHAVKIEGLDSKKYDYRNNYIGTYHCHVRYSYKDTTYEYVDTLIIRKKDAFNEMAVLTLDQKNRNELGMRLSYLEKNEFYGYHSGASFHHDSIYHSVNGPLGQYSSRNYKGIKISN